MDVNEELKKLPDKMLHCLARIIQDEGTGGNVKCLYCKYAPECRDEFYKGRQALFINLLLELQRCTSVKIELSPKTKAKDILEGSWVEEKHDVLDILTKKSFEEQQDNLTNPGILQYLDNQ